MIFRAWRLIVVVVVTLATLASCSFANTAEHSPASPKAPIDYLALVAAIENKIVTGSVALDNVRAVLVSVDGETKISHYRHGFTAEDATHVWSITKSVVSTLIGIAISDGIIDSLDQTLGELLPRQRPSMPAAVAAVTLRELMTMSGGFPGTDPEYETVKRMFASRTDFVAYLLREGQAAEAGTQFLYSNTSSHLVAAVLAAALRRAEGDHPRSLVDYAREKLFDPLGIDTDPAFVEPLPDTEAADFAEAGFGWGTDPQGIPVGAFGLRLTAADLVKFGELYLNDGAWHGRQIVPVEWVEQATTPSELQPQYGLMWWLYTWNGHRVYAARGYEGQLIVVVPDQKSVTAIASANRQEYPMDDEALFPLMDEVIIPTLDGA
jgi:CubicO group peptidase (beta-lactamase class C family)